MAPFFRICALCLGVLLGLACTPAEDSLEEIRELHRRGRFAASVGPLRQLVDEDPSRAETNFLLGVALLRSGDAGLAVWPLRKAAESAEYAVEAGLLLTQAMLESHTAPDAVAAIDRVLALEPENVSALALRVQAYQATGRFEDALVDIEWVLELDPGNLAVLVPRVMVLIATRRIEEAGAALETAGERLETAEEEVPATIRARLCVARGLFAFEKGDPEGAEAQYAECLEQFPTDGLTVAESVAFHDRMGRPERATEILQRALDESGSGPFRAALARRMGALGKPEEEERLLREEAEERPSPASWFALADLYVQREEFDDAVEAFEEAMAAAPAPTAMLRFAYADTLVQAEQYEKARRVAGTLEQPELRHLIRGRILLGEGDARRALAAFEAGIRLWPNNAAGRFLAGQAAERVGDFRRAISQYRESLRANPGQTEAGLLLAPLSELQGDEEGALDAGRRYVRSHPRDPQGYLVSIRIAHRAGHEAIAAEGLRYLGRLPGQAAVAVAEEASMAATGPGPAMAVEVVESSGLDLTDPANAPALRILLSQLAALGEHAKAEKLVRRALEAHPDEAEFHELRGRALGAAGRSPALAREAFARALELDPQHQRALVGLAELSAEAGERDAALALYDRAAEADPEVPAPGLAAVKLLLDAQETDEAQRRLERLLDRHPREGGAAHDLARLLAQQGELDRALDFAERAEWLQAPEAEATVAWIRSLRAGQAPTAAAPASD